jgi:hypothetical protein
MTQQDSSVSTKPSLKDHLVALDTAESRLRQVAAEGLLGQAGKGERDRLLGFALLGLAISTAAKVDGDTIKLAGVTLKIIAPWALPVGLILVVVYLMATFWIVARNDRVRWTSLVEGPVDAVVKLHIVIASTGQEVAGRGMELVRQGADLDKALGELQAEKLALKEARTKRLSDDFTDPTIAREWESSDEGNRLAEIETRIKEVKDARAANMAAQLEQTPKPEDIPDISERGLSVFEAHRSLKLQWRFLVLVPLFVGAVAEVALALNLLLTLSSRASQAQAS